MGTHGGEKQARRKYHASSDRNLFLKSFVFYGWRISYFSTDLRFFNTCFLDGRQYQYVYHSHRNRVVFMFWRTTCFSTALEKICF